MKKPKVPKIVKRRPAETSSIVTALLFVLASAKADLSPGEYRLGLLAIGAVAAAVTWLHERRSSF